MARGDAYSNGHVTLPGANSSVEIRPASGVEVMITNIFGNDGYLALCTGASGYTGWDMRVGREGGETSDSTTDHFEYGSKRTLKLFLTNSAFILIHSKASNPGVGAYYGVQTK
jgi:hypothetical protein